uniref:HEAT repeat domain-containing protein n=1 Tax=Streptomyces sp. NBC_00049 TaxID=2903617 RepID=A0AAU2JRE0_9ACTN
MSARDERTPLTSRTSPAQPSSLHDYALFRRGIEPDGRFPRRGYPLPDGPPEPSRAGLTWTRARDEVTAALAPLLADPDPVRAAAAVHLRADALAMPYRTMRAAAAKLPLTDEAAARRTARQLARTGTTPAAVSVGLALLTRLGEPEDVPCLKVLGLLRGFGPAAADALDPLDRQAAALLMLAHRSRAAELTPLIDAVAAGGDREAVRTALVGLSQKDAMWMGRRVAEAADLEGLLRAHPDDGALLAQAARLLHTMARQRGRRVEILNYEPAMKVYKALAARGDLLPPTLEHHALLLSLSLDLHSGPGALLDWPPGEADAVLELLERRLPSAAAADGEGDRHRTPEWIRRTGRQPFVRVPAGKRLHIEVVADDPADAPAVETRILVDGRPLVTALFGSGTAHAPEYLLDAGRLRAAAEPREVQLAEADCTEGCCGALYVTVRRDGDEVVWGEWRGAAGPTAPELRFEAAAYDAEVARAEQDHSWCWPARNTARLITAGLRERPELTARWDVEPGRAGTAWSEPDTVEVWFTARVEPDPDPNQGSDPDEDPGASRRYLRWFLPDDGRPPAVQAAAALERLSTTDPRTLEGGG